MEMIENGIDRDAIRMGEVAKSQWSLFRMDSKTNAVGTPAVPGFIAAFFLGKVFKIWFLLLPMGILLGFSSFLFWPKSAASAAVKATVTVSGTITDSRGTPVSGVQVRMNWASGERFLTTDGNGFYFCDAIPSGGWLTIMVRPSLSRKLAQRNWRLDTLTANLTKDFTLQDGFLVQGAVVTPDGGTHTGFVWLEANPTTSAPPRNEWLGEGLDYGQGSFSMVLPPDVYTIRPNVRPSPWNWPSTSVDLRGRDATDLQVVLSLEWRHPFDYPPPDASRIRIGPPDGLGEATVTGAAGAVRSSYYVVVVNLNSMHQAEAVAGADGSFSTRIFAPPGSALMIKHGVGERLRDLAVGVSEGLNPFPGTILQVPHAHSGEPNTIPFAAAGAIDYLTDDPNTTRNYIGSAWSMTGIMGPVVAEGRWQKILAGTYDGRMQGGLYLGGLNWTHPVLTDLDGDQDLDLILGERSGHLVHYRNDGGKKDGFKPSSWTFVTNTFAGIDSGDWWNTPAFADLDGDHDLDLLLGNSRGQIAMYRQNADHSWTLVDSSYLTITGNSASPTFADLDNDGDLDLLVGYSNGNQSRIACFRRGGTGSKPAWTLVTSQYAGFTSDSGNALPFLEDSDGDGDLDLFIGQTGSILHYRNSGTTANPAWTLVTSQFAAIGGSSAISPAFGDLDGDGDRDLIFGEHWGRISFYRRDGSGWTFVDNDFFPFDLQGDSAPALADWDNDGDLDLLLAQAHGSIYKFTNVGNKTGASWRPDGVLLTLPWTNHPHPYPAFCDIDGDGDMDLFLGEGNYDGADAGGTLSFYRNDGSRSAPSWVPISTNYLSLDVGGWSTPAFADIDGDGDNDLFIGNAGGTITFVRNLGTSKVPSWAAPVANYAGLNLGAYCAPAFLDIDEDRDLDLLSGQENGYLTYVRNTGTKTAPSWKKVTAQYPGLAAVERSLPTAADLDGDGHADLLVGSGYGGLQWYRYLGPGTASPSTTTYSPGDLVRVEGSVKIHSPAITANLPLSTIHAGGSLNLMMLFDAQGRPMPAKNYFMSTMMTPGGLPIQRPERPVVGLDSRFEVTNLRKTGAISIEGDLSIDGRLPKNLPAGIYRPLLQFDFSGVPVSTQWKGANVTRFTYNANEAVLPPLTVGPPIQGRLIWRLLMDDFVQGIRGVGANEDQEHMEMASQIVTQGSPLAIPPIDTYTGQVIRYRMEPFLPMISFTDRRMPAPPLLPLQLPGGQINVQIRQPDGMIRKLGTDSFAQSFNRTKTTRNGGDLNSGTVQMEDVYSLQASSDAFQVTFNQYGQHRITMNGTVSDIWGNSYTGGGTYDLWVAHPLDIDPGVLPGTPFQVGNAWNPTLQLYPGVPADIHMVFSLYPNSDPGKAIRCTLDGKANPFGYFDGNSMQSGLSSANLPFILSQPGEYRIDLAASYTGANGHCYLGSMTWGGVIETPNTPLVAHGRRGLDSLQYIPSAWFVSGRDLTLVPGSVAHTLNAYFNGDIVWSGMGDSNWGGDALIMGSSIQDTFGQVETIIRNRAARKGVWLSSPGSLDERFTAGELPLFTSNPSSYPAQMVPGEIDQVAYSYRSSQRPGVRVREVIAEDGESGGYWRLNTLYDYQLGIGINGDLPNDFKFQYVGTVFRDLIAGINQYGIQGSLWVCLPDDDPIGSRTMPPFAGPGNGGWTKEGGPILTLQGQEIHIFLHPTGTMPGAVLQVGDRFRFAGHVAPTLDSKVSVTVTAPSGKKFSGGGQANKIGYYYQPSDDFVIDEPGIWSVDVRVWHEGLCSGGNTISPYPTGDVLGSDRGRYYFYAVPADAPRLHISGPGSGFRTPVGRISPVAIQGTAPTGMVEAIVDYTIAMPGFILKHGQVPVIDGTYSIPFDPVALNRDFPNLDLVGREENAEGLSDTITIGLLMKGQVAGNTTYSGEKITWQGDEVTVGLPDALTPVLSGTSGIGGAILSYTDGIPLISTADGEGKYSFPVSPNWSGSVIPWKAGYSFDPAGRSYLGVTEGRDQQNFRAILNAPKSLSAFQVSESSFTANWQGTEKIRYRLDVAYDIGFGEYVPGFQNREVGPVHSVSIYNLASDTLYYYRVRAFDGLNTSANSNVTTVRTSAKKSFTYLPLVRN